MDEDTIYRVGPYQGSSRVLPPLIGVISPVTHSEGRL